jgi:glyoxylase-like metal-dependent hydrolase (beta-lactamase superfamily II)
MPAVIPTDVPPITTRSLGDIRVHVVNTGWVRVKQVHRELGRAVATRFPSIVFARHWTELMPVLVGVIEHPEGIYLVDAGLAEAVLDPEHFACDAGTAFVYKNLLDFHFQAEQRIDRQLARLGLDPKLVRAVVMTHRHADHTEGFSHLPASAVAYVGEGDWPSHNGALACRWPKGREPILVPGDAGSPVHAFPHGRPLTKDGRVAIVPLTGHSPGHLGVVVTTDEGVVVFGGDAAIDVTQIRERKLAGIVEVPDNARRSLDLLAAQIGRGSTWVVLAHDPVLLRLFGDGTVTSLATPRSEGWAGP